MFVCRSHKILLSLILIFIISMKCAILFEPPITDDLDVNLDSYNAVCVCVWGGGGALDSCPNVDQLIGSDTFQLSDDFFSQRHSALL